MTSLITEVIIELFVVPISYKIPHSSSTPSHLRRQPIFKKNILHQKQYTLDPRISKNKRVLKEISEKLPSEKNPDTITDQLQANIAVHFLEQHPFMKWILIQRTKSHNTIRTSKQRWNMSLQTKPLVETTAAASNRGKEYRDTSRLHLVPRPIHAACS